VDVKPERIGWQGRADAKHARLAARYESALRRERRGLSGGVGRGLARPDGETAGGGGDDDD